MKPALTKLVLSLTLAVAALPGTAAASEVFCPDLADVVQVASCPTEEELLFTFNGYCSDNTRIYGKGAEVCTDYQLYRKKKNVALWETRDGKFHAYLSCDLAADTMKQAKVSQITVGKDGKMTRVACSYGKDIVLSYRSHEACRVESAAACASDPAACKAVCE